MGIRSSSGRLFPLGWLTRAQAGRLRRLLACWRRRHRPRVESEPIATQSWDWNAPSLAGLAVAGGLVWITFGGTDAELRRMVPVKFTWIAGLAVAGFVGLILWGGWTSARDSVRNRSLNLDVGRRSISWHHDRPRKIRTRSRVAMSQIALVGVGFDRVHFIGHDGTELGRIHVPLKLREGPTASEISAMTGLPLTFVGTMNPAPIRV